MVIFQRIAEFFVSIKRSFLEGWSAFLNWLFPESSNAAALKQGETESDEDYQERMALNDAIEKRIRYAMGEPVEGNKNELDEILENSQKAHFILSLRAEIYPSDAEEPQESKEKFKSTVIGLLEAAYKPLNSKTPELKPSGSEEEKSKIFEDLSSRIAEKTQIRRTILKGKFKINVRGDPIEAKTLVLFGTNPDGRCIDYCLNMYDRTETIETIISGLSSGKLFRKIIFHWLEDPLGTRGWTDEEQKQRKEAIGYQDDQKFSAFIRKNGQTPWLEDSVATKIARVRKDGKELVIWVFSPDEEDKELYIEWKLMDESSLIRKANCTPETQKPHYLHYLGVSNHANRLVEHDDVEELIEGKRHENRFGLCQTKEKYERYERERALRP